MSDHERIWLQPECCACPTDGRLWCQDPDPVDCEDGVPWTEYIRADLAAERERELVEAAYKEGYRDGTGCCDYGMVVDDDEHRDWLESNAYKALAKHEKEQGDE